jgi:hypothetical protein
VANENLRNLRGITWEQLSDLQVDDKGYLHWKGEKVKIEQRFSLRSFELFLAFTATLATVTAAVVEVLQFLGTSGGATP